MGFVSFFYFGRETRWWKCTKKRVENFICSSVLLCKMNCALKRLRWHTTKHSLPCVCVCALLLLLVEGKCGRHKKNVDNLWMHTNATCVSVVHSCLSLFLSFVHTAKIFTVAHRVYEIDSILLLWLLALLSRYFSPSIGRLEFLGCLVYWIFQTKWFRTTTAFTWLVNYIERLSTTFYFSALSLDCVKTVLVYGFFGQITRETRKVWNKIVKIVVVYEVKWTFVDTTLCHTFITSAFSMKKKSQKKPLLPISIAKNFAIICKTVLNVFFSFLNAHWTHIFAKTRHIISGSNFSPK